MDLAMVDVTAGARGITLRAKPSCVLGEASAPRRHCCGNLTHRLVTVVTPTSSNFGAISKATAPAGVVKKVEGKRRHCGGLTHRKVTGIRSFSLDFSCTSTATVAARVVKKVVAKVYRTDDAKWGLDELRSQVSLEGLFLSSDESVCNEDEENGRALNSSEGDLVFRVEDQEDGSALNSLDEDLRFRAEDDENGGVLNSLDEDSGFRVVKYLEPWQMKRMVAASNLGARCVNIEALALDVGLDKSDVLAWLENVPSKAVVLNSNEGSFMEDVHIVEEVEKPAIYVPPPPIPSREVNMRRKVENLMYTLKDVMSVPLADIITDERRWNGILKLFSEAVELQNSLFCLRGRDELFNWVQLLGRLGVVVKLLDIYYENTASKPYNRWVYATWTASLTDDLGKSVVELGLTDWWARFHGPELMNSSGIVDEQHALENQSMDNRRVLQLSGDWRFEMEESGQVTNVRSRWYKLAEQGGGEDLTNSKMWLSGILRRELR